MLGEMRILDATGDTKIIWDSEAPAEVRVARETFEKLTKEGFTAFSVKKSGDKGDIVRGFNSELEKLILVPRMAGG